MQRERTRSIVIVSAAILAIVTAMLEVSSVLATNSESESSSTAAVAIEGSDLVLETDEDELKAYKVVDSDGETTWTAEIRVNPDGEVTGLRLNHAKQADRNWHIKSLAENARWQDLELLAQIARSVEQKNSEPRR